MYPQQVPHFQDNKPFDLRSNESSPLVEPNWRLWVIPKPELKFIKIWSLSFETQEENR